MTLPNGLLVSYIAIISLVVGSFLNVVIYRLPRELSLSVPRSFCTNCKKTIPFYWNIPILSYILLKGRCRYCNVSISLQYPAVEILTLILSLIALFYWGFSVKLGFILLFIYFIIPMIFIDLYHYILPDELTLGLLWVGLIANIHSYFCLLPNAVIGAIVGYLSLWSIMKIHFLLTKKIGIGHGDFKLFAALGAWYGWNALPNILLLAAVPGIIVGGAYLMLNKKSKNTPIPFGPFLCTSGFLYPLIFNNFYFLL